uniref:Uncharacterized protein n=1 Tax=Knipowitschia caucasica TaxID=637954 RepID=A0AAV2K9E9_KNICA
MWWRHHQKATGVGGLLCSSDHHHHMETPVHHQILRAWPEEQMDRVTHGLFTPRPDFQSFRSKQRPELTSESLPFKSLHSETT